uniref:lipid-A-disaccharide synthase n=1 Tax=Petrachloros mirabilis TaxID=2918835 RepID=UPI001EE7C6F4|nr:lipid-A-disaccharide synthase [Petrachloros mirabilis]
MTWVTPVVTALRRQWSADQAVRISVILAPCAHASGQEATVARRLPVDRVQEASHFGAFLLWGKTAQSWQWHSQGIVLFLGGDQFAAVIIGKRLGYAIVTYAERSVRWLRWIDHCGVVSEALRQQVTPRLRHKVTVVGDLMVEAQGQPQTPGLANLNEASTAPLVGLLPGSKPLKLRLGVPLMLAIADQLRAQCSEIKFVIPLAPTVSLEALAAYANPANPLLPETSSTAQLGESGSGLPALVTAQGTEIPIWTATPAHDLLARCRLCLTTVGANTAELAALGVPMMVLLPTQYLDALGVWDGLLGLLTRLPGLGKGLKAGLNWLLLQRGLGFTAWPNIWAEREIVPEFVGPLQPQTVALAALALLNDPERLRQIRTDLSQVRGQPGAAQRLVDVMASVLPAEAPSLSGLAISTTQGIDAPSNHSNQT